MTTDHPAPGTTNQPRGHASGDAGADRWTCEVCGERYVVVSLVRDCMARHEVETRPT